MTDVACVAAIEVSHPVSLLIFVKADNDSLHGQLQMYAYA